MYGIGITELFVMLLVIAIPVAIGVLIVSGGLRVAGFRGDESGKLLRERLARGEITKAEFENAQRILGR